MTTNKLTVRLCRERTQEILKLHKQIKSGYRGMSLEHVQGLIDDLREDVIQTIANGSKCPYALTRLIADLPRVDYGTIPVEPPSVAELAANFSSTFKAQAKAQAEVQAKRHAEFNKPPVVKVAASTMYGKQPCKDCHQAMKLDENGYCFRCTVHHSKSSTPAMTSEQAYAIREFLDTDSNEPLRYPPGMSPSELREAFDSLLVRYEKLTTAIANAYNELNSNPEPPDYDRPGSCLSDR